MTLVSLICILAGTTAAAASLISDRLRIILEAAGSSLFVVGLGLLGADLMLFG